MKNEFLNYLKIDLKYSENTIKNYKYVLDKVERFLKINLNKHLSKRLSNLFYTLKKWIIKMCFLHILIIHY